MAIKLVIFAPGADQSFAGYTYDSVTGAVLEVAVGSLVQGSVATATLTGNGHTLTCPDASGNEVVSAAGLGLTVSLPQGGPGNFRPSYG